MKSIRFRQYGEPADVLAVEERPVPEPGNGEARVRMLATPVNPSDLRGLYAGVQPQFPAPAGFEGVGVVDALDPGAQDLARDEQAATFVINPASAILMLHHVLAVPREEWLLQSAANSQIGRMMIRLAKRAGIKTINIVRRRESVAELQELGADAVIVSTDGPIDEQVRGITGPQGVRYAVDPVAGETGTEMFKALGEEGRMLVYGSLTGEPVRVGEDPRYILAGRRVLEVFWLGYWLPRLKAEARRKLTDAIAGPRPGRNARNRARTPVSTRRDWRSRSAGGIGRQTGKGAPHASVTIIRPASWWWNSVLLRRLRPFCYCSPSFRAG
jgi:NADPH2:quinone reductase